MEIKSKLMQKLGITTTILAIELIQFDVDDRIPTVANLSEKYEMARGTVQSALKLLQEYEAIKLESRGHLGTFITYIDHVKLLEIAGIKSIVGVMPLPYSKRYEGLATGIYNNLNDNGISANLAFMRGSNHRLKSLIDGRYDFAITSRLTADYYMKSGEEIEIIAAFGDYSYVNEHVLLIRDGYTSDTFEDCKVGIDKSSIDQSTLTETYFKDKKVEYINLSYSQLTNSLLKGEIDCAIWNKDDLEDKDLKIKFVEINRDHVGISDTEAVMITLKKNKILPRLFAKKLNKMEVLEYQGKVIKGLIMPNY